MSARPEAMANQIADAVVEAMKGIDQAVEGATWLTTVKKAKRSLMLGDLTGIDRPATLVQVLGWKDAPIGPETHEATLSIGVHCLVDNNEESEAALNRLAADVIVAITRDEGLGQNAEQTGPLVTSILPTEYEPQIDAMQVHGIGIVTVKFEAVYSWVHGAP